MDKINTIAAITALTGTFDALMRAGQKEAAKIVMDKILELAAKL